MTTENRPRISAGLIAGVLIVVLILAAALAYGIHSGIRARVEASGNLARQTEASEAPTVAVVHPESVAPAA